MKRVSDIQEIQTDVESLKGAGHRVGFVPTMGALHEGHISLVRASKLQCDKTVVSIFVNPSQFNKAEDLEAYPRTLEADCELLLAEGVDYVFTPDVESFYPTGYQTWLTVDTLSKPLEGAFRPGHFRGVATVVCKLFHAVPAQKAFFGEKDFQQLAIIRRMVQDLHIPIEVMGCPIIRNASGLALSSRNKRLSDVGKEQALIISKALDAIVDAYTKGMRLTQELYEKGKEILATEAGYTEEYLSIVDEASFEEEVRAHDGSRVLIAGYVEGVRLIDNTAITGTNVSAISRKTKLTNNVQA